MADTRGDRHGLLVVDKPGLPPDAGGPEGRDLPTSHDVVQRVRRISRQRRIGHTGTLDPMASGILVLCLGAATRLVEYYQGHAKRYAAEVTLGAATDTYDALGAIVDSAPVPALTRDGVEAVLAGFRGLIRQKPPIYSALKQEGESLHRKARRGETVEIQARPVTIERLVLGDLDPAGRLRLDITCSAGTYIRSLAHDLGAALGTCGHLSYLRRTAAGPFSVEQAHTLDHIEASAEEARLDELLLPVGTGLDLPALVVDGETALRLGQGQRVWIPTTGSPPALVDRPLARCLDGYERFLGVVRALEQADPGDAVLWKAEKWLAHHLK